MTATLTLAHMATQQPTEKEAPSEMEKALAVIARVVKAAPGTPAHKASVTQARRFLTQHGVKVD